MRTTGVSGQCAPTPAKATNAPSDAGYATEIKGYKKLAEQCERTAELSPTHSGKRQSWRNIGAISKHAERSGKRITKAERLILARRCVCSRSAFDLFDRLRRPL